MKAVLPLLRSLVHFALPPRCPGCGVVVEGDHRLCLQCWRSLDFLTGEGCAACNLPMPGSAPGLLCGSCLAQPPTHDGVRAAVVYGDTARTLVLRLKYGARPALAGLIARQLTRHMKSEDGVLVPVPLHRGRLWRRGYNQSALIARALAEQEGAPLALEALVRSRATPVLRGLSARARAKAMKGAFHVPPDQKARIEGRTVWLVDDVFTSGATASACATALKRAGAARVVILCWARVLGDLDFAGHDPHFGGEG